MLYHCKADNEYDQIGQLIEDDAEFISHIEWNTQNKIKRVVRAHPDLIADPSGNVYRSDLEFVYDPLGNRVAKIEKPRDGDGEVKSQLFWIYTLYARDATGNTLATYSRSFETPQDDDPIDHLAVQAHEIYGSKRLGTSRVGVHMQREFEINTMTTASYHAGDQYYLTEDIFDDVTYFTNQVPAPSNQFTHVLGRKQYELSNHLGNVLATISDAKTPQGTAGNGQALGYAARIVNLQDYYPFGMLQPGRQFSEEGYNYGYQAQEIDDEYLAGAVTFKYRIHDARIGRFLSVDPLAPEYPWNSTYAFSENRVVDSGELEGLETFRISDKSVSYFDSATGELINTEVKSLTMENTSGIFRVIDENEIELSHFKYCTFICQMKGFSLRDKTGGSNGRIPSREVEAPNLTNGVTTHSGGSRFEVTAPLDDALGTFQPNTDWTGLHDRIDDLYEVWSAPSRLGSEPTTVESRSSEFNSFTHIRIFNNTTYPNDEISGELKNTVWYRKDMNIEFTGTPADNNSSTNFSIEYGTYDCDECP